MFIEKKRKSVSPRLLTANGDSNGLITVASTADLFVKQEINLTSSTQPNLKLEIKRFVSINSFRVGLKGEPISRYADINSYLVSEGASISAAEQDRPGVKPDEYNRAVYAEEPIVAKRVIMVDENGNYYNEDNPIPTTANFSGTLEVNTDGFDLVSPDSSLMVGSENGTKTGIKHAARVDSELDLRVGISDGPNKAEVNSLGELSVVDLEVRNSLVSILTALSGVIDSSDATTHSLLGDIILGILSIDNGIPNSLGQNVMANSMPVTIASDQAPIPIIGEITATLGDEPIKISGTENGQPNGPEFPFVNNLLQQILKAKDRSGTISYADFGTKNQRILKITYTAPSIGSGLGFTAEKEFTYTLVGNRYRRDTPGNWNLV